MKLVSLNIEGSKHLHERILPFLEQLQPDVICLQEVFAVDVTEIEGKLGFKGKYIPLAFVDKVTKHTPKPLGLWGIYLGTCLSVVDFGHDFYKGSLTEVPKFLANNDPNAINRALMWMEITDGKNNYLIANTHFTWSPQGNPTLYQHQQLDNLLNITQKLPPHILCGDFNAPRGGEIFTRLQNHYHDNIPSDIKTTLDGDFHYAGKLEYVVDGMFSHPEYVVNNVKVMSGLSDHMAIVGEVSK